MTEQSKIMEAVPSEGSAKLELSTSLSVDTRQSTFAADAEAKNFHKSVSMDKSKGDLKYSKKSISHWKKLQLFVAIGAGLIAGANNSVQLWQSLDISNRIGELVNHLPKMEEVRGKSSTTN